MVGMQNTFDQGRRRVECSHPRRPRGNNAQAGRNEGTSSADDKQLLASFTVDISDISGVSRVDESSHFTISDYLTGSRLDRLSHRLAARGRTSLGMTFYEANVWVL